MPLLGLSHFIPDPTKLAVVLPPVAAAVARAELSVSSVEALEQSRWPFTQQIALLLASDRDAIARAESVNLEAEVLERIAQPDVDSVARVLRPRVEASPDVALGIGAQMAEFRHDVIAVGESLGSQIAEPDEEAFVSLFETWRNTRTYADERAFLELHTDLLAPQHAVSLARLLKRSAGVPSEITDWHHPHNLINEIRERHRNGSDLVAAIHDVYVDRYGDFALDLPEWLADVRRRTRALQHQGARAETAATRVAAWNDAIERAQSEQLDPLIVASAQLAKYLALHDLIGIDRLAVQEESLACLQAAQQVFSQTRFPNLWANIQHELGHVWFHRSGPDRASDLEAAITYYRAALTIRRPNLFPDRWAALQCDLGAAYTARIRGTRAENVEIGLDALLKALTIKTMESAPFAWAQIQHNLGSAYCARIHGDRADNLEAGIAALRAALTVFSSQAHPFEWALTKVALGNCYSARIRHGRGANQEVAIAAYREALVVFSQQRYPFEWLITSVAMGSVYRERMRGDRADNHEVALALFKEALAFQPGRAFTAEYARAWLNCGIALGERSRGGVASNQEASILAFEIALTTFTHEAFPIERAKTLWNLANVFRQRKLGPSNENIEQALALYRAALTYFSAATDPLDCASILANLGATYHLRGAGTRSDNLEAALDALQRALAIYATHNDRQGWALTQINLGSIYRQREEGDRSANLEAAIAAYYSALAIRTPDSSPIECRDACINLGNLAFSDLQDLGDPRALPLAHAAYEQARAVQRDLALAAASPQGKGLARSGWIGIQELYSSDARALWELGDPYQAVVVLEEGRAQALAEAVTISQADTAGVCRTHRDPFISIQRRFIDALSSRDPSDIYRARNVLLSMRDTIRQCASCEAPAFLTGSLTYATLVDAARDGPVIYLSLTAKGCLIQAVLPDGRLATLDLPMFTWRAAIDLFVRTGQHGETTGGYSFAISPRTQELLHNWQRAANDDIDLRQRRHLPLRDFVGQIDASFATLRDSVDSLVTSWQEELSFYAFDSLGQGKNNERGQLIRTCLDMTLDDLLVDARHSTFFLQELTWYLKQHEIEVTTRLLGSLLMQPLREWLNAQGWSEPEQSLALIPVGNLGLLPLNAALVRDPRTGQLCPFQETCLLTFQASAQSLIAARTIGESLPRPGSFFFIANPQPTSEVDLEWAEREGHMLASMAVQAGRLAHAPLLGEDARLSAVIESIEVVRRERPGALVTIAAHGYADPVDPSRSFLLLANDRRLTLGILQQGRILRGLREVNMEGCATGLGDLEHAPDELLSLAGGVLQAGAAAALSTQWSVSDRATFMLMLTRLRFMLREPHLSPAHALRNAARWLRTATQHDLKDLEDSTLAGPDLWQDTYDRAADSLRGARALPVTNQEQHLGDVTYSATDLPGRQQFLSHIGRTRAEYPYAHPIYWGAFVVYGW